MKVGSALLLGVTVLLAGCTGDDAQPTDATESTGAAVVAPVIEVEPVDPAVHVHPQMAKPIPKTLRWEPIAPMPLPRAEHTVVNIGSVFYVIAGFLIPSVNDVPVVLPAGGGPIPTDAVDIYDSATDTWSSGPPFPAAVNHAPGVEYGNEVYVFAGTDSHKYNPDTDRWTPIAPPPNGHSAGVATVIDHKIYVTGGNGDGATALDVYDPNKNEWKTLEGLDLPTRRDHTSGVEVHGTLVVAGGDQGGHSNNSDKVEIYDPKTKNWTEGSPVPVVRGSHAGVYWLDRLVILGGQSGNDGEEAYRNADAYDRFSDTWTALPDMPQGRHGFGAGVWQDEIYVFGGAPKQGIYGFADSAVLRVA